MAVIMGHITSLAYPSVHLVRAPNLKTKRHNNQNGRERSLGLAVCILMLSTLQKFKGKDQG